MFNLSNLFKSKGTQKSKVEPSSHKIKALHKREQIKTMIDAYKDATPEEVRHQIKELENTLHSHSFRINSSLPEMNSVKAEVSALYRIRQLQKKSL